MTHGPIDENTGQLIFGAVGADKEPVMPDDKSDRNAQHAIGPDEHHEPLADNMPLLGVVVARICSGHIAGKGFWDQDIIENEVAWRHGLENQQEAHDHLIVVVLELVS